MDVSRLPVAVVEKWSSETLGEGFVPFPKKLVRCLAQLFSGAKSIRQLQTLLAIVDFKRPNLSRLPSAEYLAFVAGLPKDEFLETLNDLQEKGYIRVSGDPAALNISLEGLLSAIERESRDQT